MQAVRQEVADLEIELAAVEAELEGYLEELPVIESFHTGSIQPEEDVR